jgi:hypothetical protein
MTTSRDMNENPSASKGFAFFKFLEIYRVRTQKIRLYMNVQEIQ